MNVDNATATTVIKSDAVLTKETATPNKVTDSTESQGDTVVISEESKALLEKDKQAQEAAAKGNGGGNEPP